MSKDYSSFEFYNICFPKDRPGVAHVEINRPEKLNAFKEPMWIEYGQIISKMSHDPNIRAIVLSAAGDRAFTAGLDLQAATVFEESKDGADFGRRAWYLRRHIEEFQGCISQAEKCDKPIIMVYHGISFGLGIDMGTAVDIRICAADTKFAVKEVDIGLAADIGTLSRLPKVVGSMSWVKEVCMTARIFDAEEALKQGFVSAVYHNKNEAVTQGLKLASSIGSKSPVATQSTKALLNYSVDHSIEEGLKMTQVWNASAVLSEDPAKAIGAFMQKKGGPTFSKL